MKTYHFIIMAFLLCGCRLNISLTGSNINPNAKTILIATFPNNSSLVNPSLSQDFTNSLKDKIQSQTPLAITNAGGDYSLEGEIVSYTVSPVAIQGNDVAAMNRLTITIKVRFKNKFDEHQNFEQTFSRYVDYNSSQNFTAIESTLVASINEALTDDIFNRAFVNW